MSIEKSAARPGGTNSAEVIRVIKTTAARGAGSKEDPCRIVIQYWSFEGELLAEHDSETKIT
ncbi:MAG: carboxypeptidase [Oscillospiraceae bacterium]|nr:carboxypeptidase [Oscillospiraceae bacterium]